LKAICVNSNRELEIREVPAPGELAPNHVVVEVEACGINHGDKTFLANPGAAGNLLGARLHDVWGASASGKVRSIGPEVPAEFAGRKVAIYRSLSTSPHTIGLWCERAHIPYTSCVILPDDIPTRDYCGSLVNAITAYAFLEQVTAEGHKGVIATAGNSATGLALTALAERRHTPVILLVRSAAAREELRGLGVEHVIATNGENFETELGDLATQLQATAVFDGVGGELISRIAPHLPMNATIYLYGFLGGSTPISVSSRLFVAKNLVMKRFSNFNSATVADPHRLTAALTDLRTVIANPMFRTKIGKSFRFEQIDEAMAYEATPGSKAILVPATVQRQSDDALPAVRR